MAILRYKRENPLRLLEELRDEVNKLFNFSSTRVPSLKEEILAPSLDLWEDKNNIYVESDIPGFERKANALDGPEERQNFLRLAGCMMRFVIRR